ncbi:hypothetical protein HU200_006615 [Digitaria exilis]|uniref:Uncharacterized protein n=1 Tax=Digitaria exilis TaxID=1010633 RepID=A0A835FNS4_9POAL|nr:hypothetical protein HU200_006615 [Digitaria exilis]
MAGGLITTNDNVHDYGEGMTFSVMVTCLMAASCGLILGYDSGISGVYSTLSGKMEIGAALRNGLDSMANPTAKLVG